MALEQLVTRDGEASYMKSTDVWAYGMTVYVSSSGLIVQLAANEN